MYDISKIVNKYLRDAAVISDIDNNGIINDGKEASIFIEKSRRLLNNELITSSEYKDVFKSSLVKKTDTYQSEYKKDLDKQIDEELKRKLLPNTLENMNKAVVIIKRRKEINIELEIHENKLKQLQVIEPKDKYGKRTAIIESVTATGGSMAGLFAGGIAGLKAGGVFGAAGGPIGAACGACVGAFIGMAIGIYCGQKIGENLITEGEIAKAQQEINAAINKEETILQNLKQELLKL